MPKSRKRKKAKKQNNPDGVQEKKREHLPTVNHRAVSSNPLPWLRGLGVVSMAIGGLGLMQLFFWPSVAFFYAGLFVLSVDLWFEKLVFYWKALLWILCLLIGLGFLYAVVLRPSPVSMSYRITDTKLVDLYITNDSDRDDYHEMDLTFSTNSPDAHFDKLRNLSEFPILTVIDQGWKLTHKGESAMVYSDGKDWFITRPTLRVRCALLPKRSSVHVLLSVVKGLPGRLSGIGPALDWDMFKITGSFNGRFKEVELSNIAVHEN